MVKITQMTFSRVAGLESLASLLLRLYHTQKVWCGGINKRWVECGKAQE